MDLNITAFEDVLGGCERIYKTPIPLSYTRLTSRFLIVYLFSLPWCLVPSVSPALSLNPRSSLILHPRFSAVAPRRHPRL
jgi:predicted membrane chloride channel (bestrophin family)